MAAELNPLMARPRTITSLAQVAMPTAGPAPRSSIITVASLPMAAALRAAPAWV